jgi:N-hydroxyarylamine O-acetyltransferase
VSKIDNAFSAVAPAVDLDAYFARIGYDGPREPTLAVLRAITQKHPDAIPFENLDVLLGRGISLDPAAIDAKLITAGRGGYCYEQNGLLKRVLTAIGFDVTGLMARVLWMAPAGAPARPRSHMVLGVEIDGETWLADSGFGGCVLTAPLRLFSDDVQDSPNGQFRIVDRAPNWASSDRCRPLSPGPGRRSTRWPRAPGPISTTSRPTSSPTPTRRRTSPGA